MFSKPIKKYPFKGGTLTVLADNIVLVKYSEIKEVSLENILDLKRVREDILGSRNYHTITDVTSGLLNMSKEAKNYIAKNTHSASNRLSDSIIVKGITKKIEVSTYIKIFKPLVKTKVFLSVEKAKNWIKELEEAS